MHYSCHDETLLQAFRTQGGGRVIDNFIDAIISGQCWYCEVCSGGGPPAEPPRRQRHPAALPASPGTAWATTCRSQRAACLQRPTRSLQERGTALIQVEVDFHVRFWSCRWTKTYASLRGSHADACFKPRKPCFQYNRGSCLEWMCKHACHMHRSGYWWFRTMTAERVIRPH